MASNPIDPILILRQDFRNHLEQFYAQLNLAPPYHSIEKAVQNLSNTLKTKPENFTESLLNNPGEKWMIFQDIFLAAGLQNKHRGIILQLVRSSSCSVTSSESLRFLTAFIDAYKTRENPAKTMLNQE